MKVKIKSLCVISILITITIATISSAHPIDENKWVNMNPSTHPSIRTESAMVYNKHYDRIILFGGKHGGDNGGTVYFSDTWAYDYNTNTWTNRNPSTRPTARAGHSLAYNSKNTHIYLFGGLRENPTFVMDGEKISSKSGQNPLGAPIQYFNDLWLYNYYANIWGELSIGSKPSPRAYTSMVYDAKHERLILFGGYGQTGALGDTWTLDFISWNWQLKTPLISPPARYGHNMVYDEISGKVILFGGKDRTGSLLSDTWAYDYETNTWTNKEPAMSPYAGYGYGLVYDDVNKVSILYGYSVTYIYRYDTNEWTNPYPSTLPTQQYNFAYAFDSESGRMIIFGGRYTTIEIDETWSYNYQLIRPYVVNTYPYSHQANVPINTHIAIEFNIAMNMEITESAISIIPEITYSTEWDVSHKILIIIPEENLEAFTTYSIFIGQIAESFEGKDMANNYEFDFSTGQSIDTTAPFVLVTIPANKEKNVSIGQEIRIVFSERMDTISVESSIVITPSTSILFSSWSGGGTVYVMLLELSMDTTYVITILDTAKDMSGNPLESEYTFRFKTESPPPPSEERPPPQLTYSPELYLFPEIPLYSLIVITIIIAMLVFTLYARRKGII